MRILLTLVSFFVLCGSALAIPAFPGAEGYGANVTGGRGGTVCIVSNLNDSGTGSFRAALEASGDRIVVFTVSGYINLATTITVSNPNISIFGQTSPGGVAVIGHDVIFNTHNVIVQHMRFRGGTEYIDYARSGGDILYYSTQTAWSSTRTIGECAGTSSTTPPTHPKGSNNTYAYPCALGTGEDPGMHHGMQVAGQNFAPNVAYDLIFDHCSFSGGVDETLSLAGGIKTTTVQNSLVLGGISFAGHSEGGHSKGMLISGYGTGIGSGDGETTVSLHHNYIAHGNDRMPLIAGRKGTTLWADVTVDVVNNVVYDWYGRNSGVGDGSAKINWSNNYFKPGDYYSGTGYEVYHWAYTYPVPANRLYVHGNLGVNRTSQSDDQWSIGVDYYDTLLSQANWDAGTRWSTPAVSETEMSLSLATTILSNVGATLPSLDSLDSSVIADFSGDTGSIILTPAEYTAMLPTYSTPTAPTDSDNDGMADSWEVTNFGDLSQTATGDYDSDGYSNIENYIHSLSRVHLLKKIFTVAGSGGTRYSWQ